MTPSKQALDPLTLEQLDALEIIADQITTRRLIAMARHSIFLKDLIKECLATRTDVEDEK